MMGVSELYMPSDVDIIGYAGNEQELMMDGNRALQRVDY